MQLATFIILVSLYSALSSKSNDENEQLEEAHSLHLQLRMGPILTKTKTVDEGTAENSPSIDMNRSNVATNFTRLQTYEREETEKAYLDPTEISSQYDEVVEHVRKILESEGAGSRIGISQLEHSRTGNTRAPNDESAKPRDENKVADDKGDKIDKTGETYGVERFTKLSRNGGVENNLSNKEEISTKHGAKYAERNAGSPKFVEVSLTTEIPLLRRNVSEIKPKRGPVKSEAEIGDYEIENQTDQENSEPNEEDIAEAANFGLKAMHDLYYVKEPKLHSMGLFLKTDDPARYVAAFNDQTEEARTLAKYGYAVLESTTMFFKKFPDQSRELSLARNSRRTPLQQQCPQRGTPQCPPASLRYRTSDGSCNNLQNLWWGSAMSSMQRFLPAVYHDGIQTVRRSRTGRPLPSARDVSSLVHEDRDIPLASVTHMLMQWGQFVDHDVTATGQSRGFNGTVPQCCLNAGAGFQPAEFMHPECLPIVVNARDNFFGPLGVRCLEFLRSGPAPREDCEFGPREQLTQVTSYLDASTVYSSHALQSDSLRIFRNGLLQYGRIQSRRPLLPRQNSDLCKHGSLSTSCFRAGDGRLSEQPALTSLHIVFLRLHNRLATRLAAINSHWSDEKLFQESRRIVGAIVQHVTYREYLPIVLGHEVMKIFDLEVLRKGYYTGYDASVNPTIANAFSTAAYRFGHSLVQHSFVRFSSDHKPIFNNVSIHDEFSNPVNLETAGSVDRLLLGLVNQPSQKRDEFITAELTNHLFQTPRFPFGMDLASLNIQRGRDHGIPPYVKWREPCGLSAINSFDDLTKVMSLNAAKKFRLLYSTVEDIDLYPAGLSEKSVTGGLVGPTFACIIAQQFGNLRKGDRFWYENENGESSFTPGQLQQIRRVTLAQILCRTMDNIETIQPFVFLTADGLRNQRLSCDDDLIGELNLAPWTERPPQVRSSSGSQKKTYPNRLKVTSPSSKLETTRSNSKEDTKFISQRQKPLKTNIHQHNKIVVRAPPIGVRDNVTIVVNNHAVNSPVFVNDAIYGTNIRVQPAKQKRPSGKPQQDAQVKPENFPVNSPPKPIPVAIPSFPSYPYVPHAFGDPSNPNPLSYGWLKPDNQGQDIVYDSLSSPRPTLYTYYPNQYKPPTTQAPYQQVDGYLFNYGTHEQYHERPSGQMPAYGANAYHDRFDNRPIKDYYGWSKPYQRPEQYFSDFQQRPYVSDNKNSWPSRPSYEKEPPRVQSDPDGWTTIPQTNIGSHNHNREPVRKPVPSASDSFYHGRPTKRPQSDHEDWPYNGGTLNKPNRYQDHGNWGYPYQREPPKRPAYQYGEPIERPNPNYEDHEKLDSNYARPYDKLSTASHDEQPLKGPTSNYQAEKPPTSQHLPSIQSNSEQFSVLPSHLKGPFYKPVQPTKVTIQTYGSRPINHYENSSPPHEFESYQEPSTTISYHSSQPSMSNYKPIKVQSVTIVTETSTTVHQPVNSYRPQDKVENEIPTPISQVSVSENGARKRGQYYYEKNVLHRYPDKVESIDQDAKNNHYSSETNDNINKRKIFSTAEMIFETGFIDNDTNAQVVRSDNIGITTTPTIVIDGDDNNGDNENEDEADDELQGAFSEEVEHFVSLSDSVNYWLKPQEDFNLSSMPEMPEISSEEYSSSTELPKPMKIRRTGS